jgi:hypothetical protein
MNTNKAQRFKNCKILDPPQGKKRPIDDLVTDCDTETDIGKRQAKERSLRFTSEELELPELYATDDTGDIGEDRESVKELIKAAAESIATCWKKIHQKAGLLKVDGTHRNGLAQSSKSGMEPPAKRACQSHDSHGLRGGSHNSRSAADLVTNDDPTSDVDQDLRESPTGRNPDEESIMLESQEHTLTRELTRSHSTIHPNNQHNLLERSSGQKGVACSTPERTAIRRSDTRLSTPSLVEPRQEGASSVVGNAGIEEPALSTGFRGLGQMQS